MFGGPHGLSTTYDPSNYSNAASLFVSSHVLLDRTIFRTPIYSILPNHTEQYPSDRWSPCNANALSMLHEISGSRIASYLIGGSGTSYVHRRRLPTADILDSITYLLPKSDTFL
jgi:hypothetical protein